MPMPGQAPLHAMHTADSTPQPLPPLPLPPLPPAPPLVRPPAPVPSHLLHRLHRLQQHPRAVLIAAMLGGAQHRLHLLTVDLVVDVKIDLLALGVERNRLKRPI